MVRRADFGLMIWDGMSPGTALNVLRLAIKGSPCVVYDVSRALAGTVRNPTDWKVMLKGSGPDVLQPIEARMTADERTALP